MRFFRTIMRRFLLTAWLAAVPLCASATIQFTKNTVLNGHFYNVGDTYTFSAADEATQVAAGNAVYVPIPQPGILANVYATSSILRARDYNILPTNTAAQNDVAFSALKVAMQASRTTVWRVIFEPGTYHYTNNRWFFNVQNFICECYGVTFQNDSSSSANVDGDPFNNREMFDDSGDVPGIISTVVNGDLINTATAGSFTVTTTVAANAGHFAAGNRVMIYGYDQQQAGYPPNMRYFEEKTVTGINAGTGVVTFSNQLQNTYDSRWWDTANYGGFGVSFGAPRILNLDRTNYKRPKLIWIRGATLPANSITPASNFIQITADVLILEDVTGVAFNFSETDQAYCIRCKMSGDQSDGDKLVDRMVIMDSVIDPNPGFVSALTDCVAINDLTVIRSKLMGSINQCTPRHLTVQDTDIIPATTAIQGIGTANSNPIRSVTLGGTRIFNTGSLSNGFTNKSTPGNSFTVGSVSGTTLQMTWNATAMTVADNIDYGMTLTDTTQGCNALVTGIFLTGGNTLNITQTGCAAPAGGDNVNYYDVINLSDLGGNTIVGTQVPFWRTPPGPSITTGPVISGNPRIVDSLAFYSPNVATSSQIYFTNQSYGLQISSNNGGTNIGYFTGSSFNMSNGSTLNADTLNANSAGLAVSQGTKTVNIGTGTTTGTVTIGGGSNAVTIAASAGNLTLANVTTGTNADFVCMAASNKVTLQTSSCTISSLRYKENVEDVAGSVEPEIAGLRVASFNMKEHETPNPDPNFGTRQVGLIAENVAEVAPECAIYDDDMKTPKSYRQECIIALLVRAVQEQQREIRRLKRLR